MLNDPTGDAREQLTKVLDQISQTIVQNLNQKYGENFIFSGADGHNVPFEIKDDKLYYRGVPVDSNEKTTLEKLDYISKGEKKYVDIGLGYDMNGAVASTQTVTVDGKAVEFQMYALVDANGTTYVKDPASSLVKRSTFDAMDPADQPKILKQNANPGDPQRFNENGVPDPNGEYYLNLDQAETMTKEEYETAVSDAEKLKYLMNEKQFVDIGLGFQENENGQLIESSAYNAALNGLTFIGYGLDADGDPKNIYSLVQKMKEISSRVKDGENWTDEDYDEFDGLVKKLERASSEFKTEFTNMSAGTQKLENNVELLEDNFYNLQEQYADIEDVDMADAITSFVWAQYCYNAALKVGNSVLSESLMDYLK
jgi:flagellin-like hook-associated protein FlgL